MLATQLGEFIGSVIAAILLKCRGELVTIIAESIRAAMQETYSEHKAESTTKEQLKQKIKNVVEKQKIKNE